jgi:two-component system chemotaxis sensor kinase CheA
MVSKQEAFLKKLMATFRVEAADHLKTILAGLADLEWRRDAEQHPEILETVFREVHSLKGAARAVNLGEVELVCQALENAFAALKDGRLQMTPAVYDILYKATDILELLLVPDSSDFRTLEQSRISNVVIELDKAVSCQLEEQNADGKREENPEKFPKKEIGEPVQFIPEMETSPEDKMPVGKTVRISTDRLNLLFRQTEELSVSKWNIKARYNELQELERKLLDWKLSWIRTQAEVKKIQQFLEKQGIGGIDSRVQLSFLKLDDFLEGNDQRLQSIEHSLQSVTKAVYQSNYEFSGRIDNLLDEMKMTLFQPFSSLLEMYPHVVRRLARDSGKEVEFLIEGGGIEIDRRILDEIKDPLMHLLRNAIDHGIETPAERLQKGKPAQGKISLHIQQRDSGKVEILLEDDGAGIKMAEVRNAALRSGLLSQDDADKLTEEEGCMLIFRSGLSTVPIITDLSGRGLGLAIVQEKVEKLGGAISVETAPNQGMIFRISLPLILATFRGILVEAGKRFFVLPTGNVERVARISRSEIKTVENRETVRLYEETLSLVSLGPVLGLPPATDRSEKEEQVVIAVLNSAGTRLAFSLDRICDEQEFLLKSLGGQLVRVRNIAGATVLGTGEVVPVLNVADLIKSAVRLSDSAPLAGFVPESERSAESERLSILVVEDSITSRTLIRNILEFAGYRVTTAVDGIDAMTVLRTDTFDLVVSDVEMPRMNGFDLTARIRADNKLADLPVILVTALESREDKERGIDVGANAYIVKSSFDQSNLLDVIKRVA